MARAGLRTGRRRIKQDDENDDDDDHHQKKKVEYQQRSPREKQASTGNGVTTSKVRSFRPLTSFLGGNGASSTGSRSSAAATSSSPKSTAVQSSGSGSVVPDAGIRASKKAKLTTRDDQPAETIELSSDEDEDDSQVASSIDKATSNLAEAKVKPEQVVIHDSSSDDADGDDKDADEIKLVGFNSSGSADARSSTRIGTTRVNGKMVSSTSKTPRGGKNVALQEPQSPALSVKAQGKRRAVETVYEPVELEVVDERKDALWADKYAPLDLASLCVHKKKVQDVQKWLEEAYVGGSISKYRRILVLSGPAGSAKTATLRVLSREMGFEITEFRTSEGDSDSYTNQFPAFLARATVSTSLKFGTLTSDDRVVVSKEEKGAVSSNDKTDSAESVKPQPTLTAFAKPLAGSSRTSSSSFSKPARSANRTPTPAKRRLILVEDLPNIFTSQGTKASFRSALVSFAESKRIASTALTPNANVPMVIIVSESLLRPGQNEGENAANRYQGSGEMSVSVRSVVPAEVFRTGNVTDIKFNPVAPTLMKKALNAILDVEYAAEPERRPSARAVELVIEASDGDIRSALNTLQFIVGASKKSLDSLQAKVEDGKGKKKGKKRKTGGKNGDAAEAEDDGAQRALLHLVATKESTLFLFHALGKVLFNKRWGENPDEDAKSTKDRPAKPEKLPAHLSSWDRRASKVDVNALFADAPVDSDMFMGYMHQNYPPFCDEAEECFSLMDYLSTSDSLLRMEGDTFSRHALTSHYSFQVSVRGALLALPSPVQRRGQKMFKSEIWDVLKRRNENLDRIHDWMAARSRAIVDTDEGDLYLMKSVVQLETLPYMGLIQAPHRALSLSTASSSKFNTSYNTATSNIFKAPHPPQASKMSSNVAPRSVGSGTRLSKDLLDIAFMPPPVLPGSSNLQIDGRPVKTALNEKDVPEDAEAGEDEKPTAPAVKVEQDDDDGHHRESEASLPTGRVEKLYLSDDDIADYD